VSCGIFAISFAGSGTRIGKEIGAPMALATMQALSGVMRRTTRCLVVRLDVHCRCRIFPVVQTKNFDIAQREPGLRTVGGTKRFGEKRGVP